MQSEDCVYLGEKENKRGEKEYFVFLGSEDNAVTPAFEDMEELRDHLANLGTSHGQPWSISVTILPEANNLISREIEFINPTTQITSISMRSGRQTAGNAAQILGRGEVRAPIQLKTLCLTPSVRRNLMHL